MDPNGEQKKVKAGKPIILHIVADKPGELHVHSSPEQEIEYDAGTSDKELTIDQRKALLRKVVDLRAK